MKEKNTTKLTLFALTWPIFIEVLLHMLMGNADVLMLSQYSDDSVAAVGVANQILFMLIVMFGFIATGTSILIAQYLGAKNRSIAAEVTVVSLFANLIFSVVISLIVFLFSSQLLLLMDLPPELLSEADTYLKVVGVFSFLQALIITAGATIRSYGFTKDAMYVTIGMNILNVIGNYLFIFGPFGIPVLGVEGVAISTVFSRAIGLIVITLLLFKRIEEPLPFKRIFKLPIIHVKNLLKIGIPSAGEHLSYNTSQLVITYFIVMLGTNALTTKVYAQSLMMFIYLFSVAISQGTQIIIGHQIGAGKVEEAYKRCLKSLKLAIAISILTAIPFAFFSDSLLAIFTSNSEIIALGGTLILLTIILEPGRSFNLVVINALRAAGDVKFPVYIGILSMWGVAVTVSYILGIHFGLGLIGVWIAMILDEWLRGIIMLLRWRSRIWVNKSFVQQKAS
ncbi:MATE family efflux transporter [Sutcliffiella rhizosphaerae]|uniref:FMN/FAD exporter YeeO n=1 Tax=Sutcliffiella rhizosphaerae TaxID=2880967 RepID=A0ABN8ADX8_9BACI|nr:MATE family efflux transporter [Sutcliffiella rhizosphaerae]CAG9623475.1 putative FMN/FAD exporter YeeO [Sutcliffiella rhizosphaerae]